MGILYKLDFSSGKSYIGITKQSSERRLNGHAMDARLGSPCLVHKAWRKYGAPKLLILAMVENRLLEETETRAIAAFGTLKPGGYNMTPGGESNPMDDPEIRARAIELNGFRGRKHAPESRAAMSLWHKENPPPIEITRLAIAANTGKKRPWMEGELNPSKRPEVKVKSSASSKGKPKSPEHRAKLAAHLDKINKARRHEPT